MNYSDTYQTPALLYIVCAMSAMAFVVCSFRWLLHVGKTMTSMSNRGFERSVWQGQVSIFMFVMVVSIFIGLYDFYSYGRPIQVYGELLILSLFFSIVFLLGKSKDTICLVRAVREIMFLGFMCALGWLVTVGAGLFITQLLKLVSVIERDNFYVVVIFISGALWNIPVLWGYYKILHNSNRRGSLKGRGFHKFLWPILLAYMVVLIPLVAQDIANSEEWHKMHNVKPMRQI